MIFQSPYWLIAAGILLTAYLWFSKAQHTDDWHRVLHSEVLFFLQGSRAKQTRRLTTLLVAAIAALALADPSIPDKNADTFYHSEGWFVLADVSRSMTLNDIAPTRLSSMRDIATQLVEQTGSRPVSLIIYAGDAFMITPPAFDTQHSNSHISMLEHGLIAQEGSNLTRALSLATSVIESSQMLNAKLFILGDTGGINTNAQAAASRLAEQGHTTHVIVIGSENSSSNAFFDLEAAREFAQAGNGVMLQSDSAGLIPIEKLNLDRAKYAQHSLIRSGISLLRWDSLAHWVLLPAIIIMLWLFRRAEI